MAINYALRVRGVNLKKIRQQESILPSHSIAISDIPNPIVEYVFNEPPSQRTMMKITKAVETLQIQSFEFYDSGLKRNEL